MCSRVKARQRRRSHPDDTKSTGVRTVITRREATISIAFWGVVLAAAPGTLIASGSAAQANPFLFILRLAFGIGGRAVARSTARRLGSRALGRGSGGRVTGRQGGKVVRTRSRGVALKNSNRKERRWTQQFVKSGLEELLFNSLGDKVFAEETTARVPAGSVVFEVSSSEDAFVDISVTNTVTNNHELTLEMYIFDIDAGVVDRKLGRVYVAMEALSTEKFRVFIGQFEHTGRKSLVVNGLGVFHNSEIFFVV